MFDFVKAMKIAERVCKVTGKCEKCILYVGDDINFCFFGSMDNLVTDWNEIERRLIEWDKAHPEPQYPTWAQWFEANFFVRKFDLMKPCVFTGEACSTNKTCHGCMAEPIPANIAKKLGIKPKEDKHEIP